MKQTYSVLTALLLASGICQTFVSAATPPNIIFIMTDDQGYGDLGCHGNPLIVTPHIDAFYQDAVRLTDYHVSPSCSPTRGALMCGQVTDKAGPWHTVLGRSYLRPEKTTIPELLAGSGYRTAMFGKWHLGDNYPYRPQDRGFQHVLYHGGGGVGQTPDYYGNDYFDDTYILNGEPTAFKGYCTDVFFDGAMDFLENHDRDQPFFIYLSTNAPHGPLYVADKYVEMYPETFEGKKVPREFFGMITNIDENFKRLQDKLDELDLTENTILIFTTDNGSANGKLFYNAGMRDGKGSAYDGGHRVPFFLRWPKGKLQGGRDIDTLTAHVDILPTFMDLTNTSLPGDLDLDGKSLKPVLYGEDIPWEDRVLFTDSQKTDIPLKWTKTSVMSGPWRLVSVKGVEKELYHVTKDPGQKNDIAKEYPEVVERLGLAYDEMWTEIEPTLAEPTYITVGTPHENPAVLTASDWRGGKSPNDVLWNQPSIRIGKDLNGYWMADFAESGNYRLSLRRWAPETRWPIHFKELEKDDNDFDEATLTLDEQSWRKPITSSTQQQVDFLVDVEAGVRRIQTAFLSGGEEIQGAYYLVIEKLQAE